LDNNDTGDNSSPVLFLDEHLTTAVVDTGDHKIVNIAANFRKNLKRPHWDTQRVRGKLIHEENLKLKISCQTPFVHIVEMQGDTCGGEGSVPSRSVSHSSNKFDKIFRNRFIILFCRLKSWPHLPIALPHARGNHNSFQ
jgi:hypothetical protein